MENLTERIERLRQSMTEIIEEDRYLEETSDKDEFVCGTPLLEMIERHQAMRLKLLQDIEADFLVPSQIMRSSGEDRPFVNANPEK
jgi:hypothetical protein